MKNITLILITCLSFTISAQKEEVKSTNLEKTWLFESAHNYDLFNRSYGRNYGISLKAKREFWRPKHFTFSYGIMLQSHKIKENQNTYTENLDGSTKDKSFMAIAELKYYPFNRRNLYISAEPFIGATQLKTEGILNLPQYTMTQSFNNSYIYFNYGVSQNIGYKIGSFNLFATSWLSLNGLWDNGRKRPADFDSRFFIGLGIGYTL